MTPRSSGARSRRRRKSLFASVRQIRRDTLSRDDLANIADALRDHGAYPISDEIYRDLYYTPNRPESLSSFYDRTIVIGGLSKSMSMTGWRLGWLAGDEDVVKAALVLHGYVTTCASTVSQKASLVAWSDEAEAARAEFRETFRARRDHLLQLIDKELGLRAITPDGAFYTMLDVSRFGPSMKVAEALLGRSRCDHSSGCGVWQRKRRVFARIVLC